MSLRLPGRPGRRRWSGRARSRPRSWSGSAWTGSSGSIRELNSFRKVFAEKAMLEAEQAEARIRAGEERPLLGVPIAIKDEVDVAGEVNTHGTDGFTEPAKADCEMVRRLREAGAIIVGLTLLPEMAICGFTESATYGVTRNPWNPQRTPGGSSGGSGSAVAAGLVPIASAGDGAGSIRIPAASCGLFGLKPSRGRVSLAPLTRRLARAGRRSAASAARSSTPRSGSTSSPAARARPRRRRRPTAPSSSRRRRRPASCGSPSRRSPPRAMMPPTVSGEAKQAVADAADLLASLGHEVDPARSGLGRHRRHRSRPASSKAWPRRSRKCPTRSGSKAAPAASAASAGSCPRRSTRRRWSGAPAEQRPRQRDLRRLRRAGDAGDGRHRAADPALGGQGRPADRARDGPLLSLLRPLEPPRQPGDGGPRGLLPTRACRSRSRSSAAAATRRRCSRSPPRSRPSGPGRTRRPPIS